MRRRHRRRLCTGVRYDSRVLAGNDLIYGLGGRDRADGGAGHDTCVAEMRVSC